MTVIAMIVVAADSAAIAKAASVAIAMGVAVATAVIVVRAGRATMKQRLRSKNHG